MKKFLALVALCSLFALPAFAADDSWSQDFEAAKKAAKEANKPILVDFTGSDWTKKSSPKTPLRLTPKTISSSLRPTSPDAALSPTPSKPKTANSPNSSKSKASQPFFLLTTMKKSSANSVTNPAGPINTLKALRLHSKKTLNKCCRADK